MEAVNGYDVELCKYLKVERNPVKVSPGDPVCVAVADPALHWSLVEEEGIKSE